MIYYIQSGDIREFGLILVYPIQESDLQLMALWNELFT